MRVLLQKVRSASVSVDGTTVGNIEHGYLLFLGVAAGDTSEQADWLMQKVLKLRLFDGDDGKLNDRNIVEVGGSILLVSQFTLCGRTEKGNRPDYTQAASPDVAKALYEQCISVLRESGIAVETGQFGAHMEVSLLNDGPVTLLLER